MAQPNDEKYYTLKQLTEIAADIEKAITIPVNTAIEAEHRVFDLSEVEKILRAANRIAVQDCGCKTENNNCDAPRDVCLSLDDEVEYALEHSNGREITVEEALDVLKRSHEAGLVHMAYVMKGKDKPGLLCSCCSCCCHTLGGLLRYGIHAEVLTSKLVAMDDATRCDDCGDCVPRCVFQARIMVDDKLVFDLEKCFGCGLCASVCPQDAIKMVPRDNQ
jgi:Pyruvate/2-oxoacid:ferredoxin oxidoreductase delta subunit